MPDQPLNPHSMLGRRLAGSGSWTVCRDLHIEPTVICENPMNLCKERNGIGHVFEDVGDHHQVRSRRQLTQTGGTLNSVWQRLVRRVDQDASTHPPPWEELASVPTDIDDQGPLALPAGAPEDILKELHALGRGWA